MRSNRDGFADLSQPDAILNVVPTEVRKDAPDRNAARDTDPKFASQLARHGISRR
jgi:hypothetical protein